MTQFKPCSKQPLELLKTATRLPGGVMGVGWGRLLQWGLLGPTLPPSSS